VNDVRPKIGGAESDLRERAGRGGDNGDLRGWNSGEELLRARQGNDIVNFSDFTLLHPAIFGHVGGEVGVRQKFANRSEAGAAVGKADDLVGIEVVLESPT